MSDISIKNRLQNDMKQAMRDRDQKKLSAIRFIIAAVKQREIDERIDLNDNAVIAILEKASKQRKDAIEQYQKADRHELAAKEKYELDLIKIYLPEQLAESEVEVIIQAAIQATEAKVMKDMGKVMAHIKPKLQGQADMGKVSARLKELLKA